jgi:hypothetical protein
MKSVIAAIPAALALICLLATAAPAAELTAPIIIDHTCTDLASIPLDAIQNAKDSCKWHYVRLSHGRQLTEGMSIIEAADAFYAVIWPKSGGSLPDEEGTLCIYSAAYSADGYWYGSGINITRNVLESTPDLNISAFSWCTELNTASASYVQSYLTAMQTLETEFPEVAFVYFTGTAQDSGSYGYNRSLRNEQIRTFCTENNKILYDFEDLDSWWFNPTTELWEQATYEYDSCTVPVEHPELAGNDAEHTSYESCEQKGRAAWWMMAVLAGWSPTADAGPPALPYEGFNLSCHPNPCNPSTTITFSLASPVDTKLAIYDASGALVKTLIGGFMSGGSQSVQWDGTDETGKQVASGVYFYRITANRKSSAKKMLLLR